MNIFVNFALSLTGLVLAANLLVKLVEKLAAKIKLSPLVIGATLIAIGTSLPETFVTISSLAQKAPSLSLGNIIGSNLANIGLIFGLGILLFPVRIGTEKTQRNNLILLLLTLAFTALFFIPEAPRKSLAFFLLAFYLVFIILEIVWGEVGRKKEDKKALSQMPRSRGKPLAYLFGIAGSLAALFISSNYLVLAAIRISEVFKIDQEVIGLTLIAVGTSLPELVTTIISGLRGQWKLISGNVQGSNIFNLSILGTVMLLFGNGHGGAHFLSLSYLVLVTLAIFILTRKYKGTNIPRYFGLLFLASYIIYLTSTWRVE